VLARSSLASSIYAIPVGLSPVVDFLFAMVITSAVPIQASLAHQPSRSPQLERVVLTSSSSNGDRRAGTSRLSIAILIYAKSQAMKTLLCWPASSSFLSWIADVNRLDNNHIHDSTVPIILPHRPSNLSTHP
jgi:hypothetical protein